VNLIWGEAGLTQEYLVLGECVINLAALLGFNRRVLQHLEKLYYTVCNHAQSGAWFKAECNTLVF